MIVWVLLVKLIINGQLIPYMAFETEMACNNAKLALPYDAMKISDCLPFAADIVRPDDKAVP